MIGERTMRKKCRVQTLVALLILAVAPLCRKAYGADSGVPIPRASANSRPSAAHKAFAPMVLRKRGDDGAFEYRIPGLAVSTNGTVIAVFDIRWAADNDLPADIDVGCLRSTDNGDTWGPMQKILDFDKSVPGSRGNGVGDPAILVDRQTGAIWVAALWSYGDHSIHGSKAGLSTNETGQYVLTRSDDDGRTWSPPINITAQVKANTNWGVCFQGPGSGIQTRGGALVFASQYWDEHRRSHSCFICSTNHGASWQISPPANPGPPDCTESQIVELNSGQLLISLRNHAGKGQRAWSIYTAGTTLDDGSWSPLVYNLPDPVCQASVIRYSSTLDGAPRNLLLFANPASGSKRVNMTVRLSEDEGRTWPISRQIDSRPAGYSCLAVLRDGSIGLLYETDESSSIGTLTFARFTLDWLEQQVGIDKIAPASEQLGTGWGSNRVVVLVDPLSSPSVVANEGAGWLKGAQDAVGTRGREAYAVIRCYYGTSSVLVWINRFKSKDDIGQDWGTDREAGTKATLDKLPDVGEEVRYYRRGGMHNNIAFRRGPYLVDVEGMSAPIEKLKQMAEVMDGNLLKAQGQPASTK
jgi:sialidase-1